MTSAQESQAPAEPIRTSELHRRVGRASFWLLLGNASSQAIRLVSNIMLTRLLVPEHFGMMSLIQVFLQGLQLFSDIGIGPAIIQNKRSDDPVFLNTAWTIQAIRGLTLFTVACLGAAPFAAFYRQPELVYLIPIVAVTALMMGFRSSKTFIQNRELALGRLTLIDLTSQVVSSLVMVVWAWLTHSIWALIGGGIVRTAILVALGHLVLPGVSNRFHWNRDYARGLFAFGQWIFVSTALTFVSSQADRMIFGRLLTMAELGVYSIALVLSSTPGTVLGQVSRTIVFPIYSRANQTGEDLTLVYARARWPLLVLGGWGLSALIACGPSVVRILYKAEYWDAGWLVQMLSVGLWIGSVLGGTGTEALIALGQVRWSAACSLGKVIGLMVFVPVGFYVYGFPGAVIGVALSEGCRYAIAVFATQRRGLHGLRQDLGATALGGASIAVATSVLWTLRHEQLKPVVECIVALIAVSAVWLPLLLPLLRQYLERPRSATTA